MHIVLGLGGFLAIMFVLGYICILCSNQVGWQKSNYAHDCGHPFFYYRHHGALTFSSNPYVEHRCPKCEKTWNTP